MKSAGKNSEPESIRPSEALRIGIALSLSSVGVRLTLARLMAVVDALAANHPVIAADLEDARRRRRKLH